VVPVHRRAIPWERTGWQGRVDESKRYHDGAFAPALLSVAPIAVGGGAARAAVAGSADFNEVDRGGHFAAWQEPELFSAEVRTGFRSLR
jgi:pimeloyl-ACP methyl ester carboxylesterase